MKRGGPNVAGVMMRVGVLATAISMAFIFFQMNGLRPAGTGGGSGAGASGGGVSVSLPHPVTETGTSAGGPSSGETPAPATPVARSSNDPRVVKFQGLLDGVKDFEDVAMNRAYAALADWIRHLTDDEAERIVRKDLDFDAIMKDRDAARGELVRATGLLVKLEAVRLVPGAGPPGVEDAWRGWLVETDGDGCFVFDFVGLPLEVSNREMVRVEGAFLQVMRFENRAGKPRDAAFLVGRRAWRLEEGEIERPFPYHYVAVCLVAAVGVFLIVMRKRAGDEQSLLQAKKDLLERRLAAKQSEPPRNA